MPYKPSVSKRTDSWWTRRMARSEFMQTAQQEQPRMSLECDPSIILNLQRDTISRVSRPPKHANFLPDYGEDIAQDAA